MRANAETPLDAKTARGFGAEGIGLCRTEHMFFDETRIAAVREMILADDEAGPPRGAGQDPAVPARRLRASCSTIMAGLPVTIRLLDPPLHEFLPHTDEEIEALAAAAGLDAAKLMRRAQGAARDQPHARLPRLPPGRRLPRDLRDAGARHLRGGLRRRRKAGDAARCPRSCTRWSAKGEEMEFLRELTDRVAKAGDGREGRRRSTTRSAP